jgi:hypothetical protein
MRAGTRTIRHRGEFAPTADRVKVEEGFCHLREHFIKQIMNMILLFTIINMFCYTRPSLKLNAEAQRESILLMEFCDANAVATPRG